MIIINFALLSESAHFSSVSTPHFAVKCLLLNSHSSAVYILQGWESVSCSSNQRIK